MFYLIYLDHGGETVKQCNYQHQASDQTLREGIQEYYAANPNLLLPDKLEKEAADFFHSHDRVHVVFGCDTSLMGEMSADYWTFFGCDVGAIKYISYLKNPGVKMIMKNLKESDYKDLRAQLKQAGRQVVVLPVRIFLRTRKMKKKWPWVGTEADLDRRLSDLRNEYGITVLGS